MGMGMGINLCPWVLIRVGIEDFYGYGFGQKNVVPARTLPIAIPNSLWLHTEVSSMNNLMIPLSLSGEP